jgi:hypothetical protein
LRWTKLDSPEWALRRRKSRNPRTRSSLRIQGTLRNCREREAQFFGRMDAHHVLLAAPTP